MQESPDRTYAGPPDNVRRTPDPSTAASGVTSGLLAEHLDTEAPSGCSSPQAQDDSMTAQTGAHQHLLVATSSAKLWVCELKKPLEQRRLGLDARLPSEAPERDPLWRGALAELSMDSREWQKIRDGGQEDERNSAEELVVNKDPLKEREHAADDDDEDERRMGPHTGIYKKERTDADCLRSFLFYPETFSWRFQRRSLPSSRTIDSQETER
ncbi:hypothetical protein DNTS_022978 [Danionella cerebrum]|uniref:Uncharacterized protein n=1 Tax=Danionella cerebrum TaxID=2873325 RepID=A0A553RHG1_9TELE|nr:hypothetical protein DNTS_022978 [Danionella translucida]